MIYLKGKLTVDIILIRINQMAQKQVKPSRVKIASWIKLAKTD